MIQELIHKQIVAHRQKVADWFESERTGLFFPFYSSFDIRDAGFKAAPVDANVFPAGFNNICPTDQESAVGLVAEYFRDHHEGPSQKVLLLTEEHTQNPYYWDNIRTLRELISQTGREVVVAMPKDMDPIDLQSASGATIKVFGARREGGGVVAGDFHADLIISNNDFSDAYADWVQGLETSINPPHELGWHQRRKDEFFHEYNKLAARFAELIEVDPWLLQVKTERFVDFDVNSPERREALAQRVDEFLAELSAAYAQHGLAEKPFCFVKNNSGTYGLGVVQVATGDDVRNWTYKSRKRMKAAKGGRDISEVIIQEGVLTTLRSQGAVAEPTIYMIGCQLAGGFLRTHAEKSERESLNSPGAVYRRLCVSDLNVSVEGCPLENVYGWLAKLGFLAIAREAQAHKICSVRYRRCSNSGSSSTKDQRV